MRPHPPTNIQSVNAKIARISNLLIRQFLKQMLGGGEIECLMLLLFKYGRYGNFRMYSRRFNPLGDLSRKFRKLEYIGPKSLRKPGNKRTDLAFEHSKENTHVGGWRGKLKRGSIYRYARNCSCAPIHVSYTEQYVSTWQMATPQEIIE